MAVVRWDPLHELAEMSERLNRVVSRQGNGPMDGNGQEIMTTADWIPTVDISETEAEFAIQVDLPGVKKEDVKVTMENGVLTIRGERQQRQTEQGRKFHRVEASYGRFVRSFTLPDTVEATNVRAEYANGILNLHLPKSEKAKPRQIDVKIA